MTASMIQATFQFGEVSPLLHARVDSPIYYRAVRRLRNCLVVPQGGIKRRFGLEAIEAINDHAGSPTYLTNYLHVKEFIFDYQDGSRYLLIFRPLAIDFYFDGVYQSTVSTAYTSSQIANLSITQSANIIFIAHGSHKPASLIRNAVVIPQTFTLYADLTSVGGADTAPTFRQYPTFDFLQNYDAFNFSVKVVATGAALTATTNTLGRVVTLTSSGDAFTANHVGGLYFADGGVIRITAFTDTKNVTGRIITVFEAASNLLVVGIEAILGADSVLTEKAFSASRGYPEKVSFFQNRLFFGRTASLLGGVWGSNFNGYAATFFLFDDSDTLDTNAISTVLQGTKAVVIQHMVAFKTLLVLTTSGIYSTPLLTEVPLTPNTISFINPQTSDSSSDVVPLIFDNNLIFFDKGGKKIKNINIPEPTQHYQTKTISTLSPHLIDQPFSAGVFENSSTEDGNWMFMTNNGESVLDDGTEMDGALSIYQSVPEQEITAWSLSTTQGKFRHVVSDEEQSFFIVERVINGNTRLFIEQLNFDAFTDCALLKTQALSTTVNGLSYLEGETVRVRGKNDDMTGMVVMQNQVVSGGAITVEFAVTEVEVGLDWSPEITPLSLNFAIQSGNNLYHPKSIKGMYVDYYKSLGIYVDDTAIPLYQFNVDFYDDPASEKTGFTKVQPMTGWNPDAQITISQQDPLPFNILGFGFEVSI